MSVFASFVETEEICSYCDNKATHTKEGKPSYCPTCFTQYGGYGYIVRQKVGRFIEVYQTIGREKREVKI